LRSLTIAIVATAAPSTAQLRIVAGQAGSAVDGTACVVVESRAAPIVFAGDELRAALQQAGWNLSDSPSGSAVDGAAVTVILADPDGKGAPESFDISTSPAGKSTMVRVRGKDTRGVMYGGLDVAEQIALGHQPTALSPRQGAAYLPVRALKFNIPFSGNAYVSLEDQAHSDWFFDLDYWRAFMRFLAYHRYNMLTFWNSHPYDRMVRLAKYPEANGLSPAELDRGIAFFHQLFGLARDCGIDTSVVTWNIHCSPAFQKAHGVKDGQDSPLIRDYQKECVRALLAEYPELSGIGTCPGEFMEGTASWRVNWIRATYLAGIAESGRPDVPFILRFWGGEPVTTARMLTETHYPGPVYLDIKYNGEHMYSSPTFHVLDRAWVTQTPKPYKLLWHLRNDCIFQLRWGDPDFAAATIRNCGGPDSAGFVMGSEIEVPGVDRFHTPEAARHKTWKYEFEKNWTRFGIWGRLGYNPAEPHAYWIARFGKHFGPEAAPAAFAALQTASKIIPLATSFHWNYMNGDWYPEANIGYWNTSYEVPFPNYRDKKMFHDVLEWIFTHTIDDALQCIPDYVADQIGGVQPAADALTPAKVADRLDALAVACEQHRRAASGKVSSGKDEWECTAMDLKALEALGHYYAAKARGATELMFFLATGEEPRRAAAVKHLEKALAHWKDLAAVTAGHYIPHEIFLFGQFDWKRYTPQAERDIQIAREIVPWRRTEQVWQWGPAGTAVRTQGWDTDYSAHPGVQPWLDAFVTRVGGHSSKGIESNRAATTLKLTEGGIGILSLRSTGLAFARVNGTDVRVAGQAPNQFLIGPVYSGDNRVELTFARRTPALPLLIPQTVLGKESIFIEAGSGKITAPMAIKEMPGVSGAKVVWTPRGKGRGSTPEGKPIENGWITYQVRITKNGDYCVHACVWWDDLTANSFYYAWDKAAPKVLGNDELLQHWHWTRAEPARLSAGTHTLTIRNREEGAVIDCLLVAPR